MTAPRPCILITGPVGREAEYAAAARAAGWDARELPLLAVEPRAPGPDDARGAYAWIAVTSSNALPWLAAALERRPELAKTPCAVVGPRSAERARALGLRVALPPATDAHALGDALAATGADAGARVLWPRGPRSSELGERLRAAGFEIDDPLAYEARPAGADVPVRGATEARAVFLASPSAVAELARRWAGADASRVLGVAIGRTTFDALLAATEPAFCDTISLPEPTPESLRAALEHVHPHDDSSEST